MSKNRILVFSSDTSVISPLKESYDVDIVFSSKAALKKLEENSGSVIIIDSDVKELNGISLYKEIKSSAPEVPVIMLSSAVTIPEAVETTRLGVADIIKKPFLKERLLESVKKSLFPETVEVKVNADPDNLWLFGDGKSIEALLKGTEEAIRGKKNILFIAEPGIQILGLVRIIHDCSGRKGLSVIDMLPYRNEATESFFWTVLQRALADSDTVYFQNFGASPEKQRESIIDYIRSRSVKGRAMPTCPSGRRAGRQVRVIVDVGAEQSRKGYEGWEKIQVPALRERKEDMPELLEKHINKYAVKHGKKVRSIGLGVISVISRYSWPGNYRELECLAESAVIACQGDAITLKDVQLGGKMLFESLLSSRREDLREFKDSTEKSIMNIVYQKAGSEEAVADILDIPKARASENISR
jgi:DNA-binding NtrC family response regulator